MKALNKFKDWYGSLVIIPVLASLSVIGRFSPVSTPHWMQEKSGGFRYDISGAQAVSCSIFMVIIASEKCDWEDF
jgi:hypothetical protein